MGIGDADAVGLIARLHELNMAWFFGIFAWAGFSFNLKDAHSAQE